MNYRQIQTTLKKLREGNKISQSFRLNQKKEELLKELNRYKMISQLETIKKQVIEDKKIKQEQLAKQQKQMKEIILERI